MTLEEFEEALKDSSFISEINLQFRFRCDKLI